jgi:outer membrane protein assembly factor BamB
LTDYRQHRYSPQRTATAPLTLDLPLSPAWAVKDGSGRLVVGPWGAVTVVRGRRTELVCLDESGARRWATQVDPGGLALTEAGVLLSGERKHRPSFFLLDAQTGKIRQETPAREGLVVVIPERAALIAASWDEAALVARSLDERMGVLWKHVFALQGAEFRGLACDRERAVACVLARGEGYLVCLSLDSGKPLWTASLKDLDPEPSGHWDPVVADGLLVVTVANGTAAVRMADGRAAWKTAASGIVTVYGGTVYVRGMNWKAPGQPSQIVALALKNGTEVWRRDYSEVLKRARGNRLAGHLGVSETHLFSGDDTGTVWALDRSRGEPAWRHRSKQAAAFAPWTIPVVARGRLYIASAGDHPHLFCYAPEGSDAVVGRPKAVDSEPSDGGEGLAFVIEAVHERQKLTRARPYFAPGGHSTVLDCRPRGKGRFFLGVEAQGGRGEGFIWVADAGEADEVLKAARKAFPGRVMAAPPRRVKPPTRLEVEILGLGVGEQGSGRGTWTLSKWTGPDGVPELYVNWSAAEKRGLIGEKDEGPRKALLRLFAALVTR